MCGRIVAMEKKLSNKERNKLALELACELVEMMNMSIDDAFVEDMEASKDEEQILVSLVVADPGRLIGYKGRNLASLQLVLALMVKQKLGYWLRVLVDVNDYRKEQKERLVEMTKKAGERVKETKQPVALSDMSSYERRLCHLVLQDDNELTTESEGEGLSRHIVVKLKE